MYPTVPRIVPASVARGIVGASAPSRALEAGAHQLREAEVEDLDEAVARDHDVLGLQVAVHDPGGVRLREPVGDLRRRRRAASSAGTGPSDRSSRSVLPSTSSIAMNEVPSAWPISKIVTMLGWFRAEAARASVSKRARRSASRASSGRQDLDRDVAREPRVARPVHLAHAARAEGPDDLVGGEPRPGGQGHREGRSPMVERVDPMRRRTRSFSRAGPTVTTSRSARRTGPRICRAADPRAVLAAEILDRRALRRRSRSARGGATRSRRRSRRPRPDPGR